MWLLMNKSYMSIVESKNKKNELLVRARVEGDIDRVFPEVKVLKGAGSDYLYRAYISREVVAEAIRQQILNIDYSNFKDSVSWEDEARHDAYLDVWCDLQKMQKEK